MFTAVFLRVHETLRSKVIGCLRTRYIRDQRAGVGAANSTDGDGQTCYIPGRS